MKQPYPIRRPLPDAPRGGGQQVAPGDPFADGLRSEEPGRAQSPHQAPLPHEQDESAHSQASASRRHEEIGEKAYADATDGSEDTDRGPVMDTVYNEKVAPDRGAGKPRE